MCLASHSRSCGACTIAAAVFRPLQPVVVAQSLLYIGDESVRTYTYGAVTWTVWEKSKRGNKVTDDVESSMTSRVRVTLTLAVGLITAERFCCGRQAFAVELGCGPARAERAMLADL